MNEPLPIPRNIRLERTTGQVLIDEVPLGYAIADEPFQVTVDPSGLNVVRIPVMAQSYGDLPMEEPAPPVDDDGWIPQPRRAE